MTDADRINKLKRELLKIAYVTQCRRSYDIATRALGIGSAAEVNRRAVKEGLDQ